VGQLDGVWKVERRGGLLPPMLGVRKRIEGDRGWTKVGPLPGLRFRVEGSTLRYLGPFGGFVDVLEREDGGYHGRTMFMGVEVGKFAMRRED
jgi:hypothetical protein